VEAFIDRLAAEEGLARDPVIDQVLGNRPPELSPRTVRHRFLRATGLTAGQIRQYQRAQRAAALLQRGASILDTVFAAGYYDQPHLTRSLRRWMGHSPSQLLASSAPG
jgi:methylphosphotriester-DNA--protein-cysteine methyltransferase